MGEQALQQLGGDIGADDDRDRGDGLALAASAHCQQHDPDQHQEEGRRVREPGDAVCGFVGGRERQRLGVEQDPRVQRLRRPEAVSEHHQDHQRARAGEAGGERCFDSRNHPKTVARRL
ncbi:MAG TPA: hypothetical protein VG458_03645 [Solirubrobacterales bacterium]|nr:hypothetical protein [Solirubrobacterales bacterium]